MNTPSFLRQVAQHYANERNLADHCFVFPHQRSRQFFFKELQHLLPEAAVLPQVADMHDFVSSLTHAVTVGGIEAAFILYEAYRQVFGDRASTFDHFIYWGDIIVNDFNDVDRDLVDTRQLYTNLSNLRDIGTDYIDEGLKEEIKRIFNIDLGTTGERFWKNGGSWKDNVADSEVKNQFFGLWEGLQALYDTYHKLLNERGFTTSGRMMRDAVQAIEQMAADQLGCERVVMVGFGLLSLSEIKIFKSLQRKQIAHFWWDNASPMLADSRNPGGALIQTYARMFPAPAPLEPIVHENGQRIRAIKIPSHVGMAKFAMHEVEYLHKEKQIRDMADAIDTAIILPDEGLIVPLIHSLPESVKRLNITLGYPLRHSSIVSLMRIVARAHKQASRDGVTGHSVYYREDVRDLLSHPIVKSAFRNEALRLSMAVENESSFNIDASLFDGSPLQPLMATVADTARLDDVLGYLDRLITFTQNVKDITTQREATDPDDTTLPLQAAFMVQYITVLTQLRQCIIRHGIPVADSTLFYLIDRLAASPVVPFTGEPLQGLQVMGVLETRNLDFDNLIVLSMNERVFPRKHAVNSFIPNDLRRAFFMATLEQQEALSTYHFYRMISRARNVSLVYDSSTQSLGSSEPSRFIAQLEKIYNCNVEHITAQTLVTPATELDIKVEKTTDVAGRFIGDGDKRLSASSINEFINCPLKFYFHNIQKLGDDNDATDFMDYGTFGTIVHDSLQELYYPQANTGPHRVTREMILEFKQKRLRNVIVENINRTYLHHADLATPLQGDAFILLDAIMEFVSGVLLYDLALIPNEDDYIEVVECEKQHNIDHFVLPGDDTPFNFTFKADRVDRIHHNGSDGPLRIIDYKTGSDETECKSVHDMFVFDSKGKRPKALLQLMLYCNAYHHIHSQCGPIMPMIYRLRKMDDSGMAFNKEQYTFTPDDKHNSTFVKHMHKVLDNLFNPDVPFAQTENPDHNCKYCHFAEFCRR